MAEFVNRVWTEDGEAADLGPSGVYTPVLTLTTNLDAATARLCTYSRVGQTVTVSGQVDVTPTAAAACELGISLPVQSSISTVYQVGGVAGCAAVALVAAIDGDADNDRAKMGWIAAATTERTLCFVFSYQQSI
jgi:hypothetical protein